jgi:molybdopterin-guanine dinucleotide biosynthesis protein A
MTRHPCSAVILAGGEGKRFNGQNKAYLKVGGQRVMDRLLSVFQPEFDEIILVTNDPLLYLEWDVMIVTDHFDQRSSLTGIHAGLFAATHPHALVTACDMPFIQPAMLRLLLGAVEPHLDVIIPKTAKGFEPLMAIYSKRCLKPMEAALMKGQYQIQKIFKHVRKLQIEESELRLCDGELVSFFNINSPVDLTRAEEWFHRQDLAAI